jgi:hypothetical protein
VILGADPQPVGLEAGAVGEQIEAGQQLQQRHLPTLDGGSGAQQHLQAKQRLGPS